jgi:hypothetical protein
MKPLIAEEQIVFGDGIILRQKGRGQKKNAQQNRETGANPIQTEARRHTGPPGKVLVPDWAQIPKSRRGDVAKHSEVFILGRTLAILTTIEVEMLDRVRRVSSLNLIGGRMAHHYRDVGNRNASQ